MYALARHVAERRVKNAEPLLPSFQADFFKDSKTSSEMSSAEKRKRINQKKRLDSPQAS